MGCQNVQIAPTSSADTWLAPLCFFVLFAPDVVLFLCVVFFGFHLLGLKMKEVKHWGIKIGLKLSMVGMLLLFRQNHRGRCVEVIVSVCMLILIQFCIVRNLLQVMVYHKELRKNFSSGTVDGHTLLITIAQS